ncbi:MAG TPA: hypothetical protein VFU43_27550 [Streptosporangiaceae bacterium]|nr:hypothetical protein [Streptosporangiaceae bacterium]
MTVDDAALSSAAPRAGPPASFEATRFATGRKNALRIEVNGSLGSLAFDFESMNELSFYDHTLDAGDAGFRRILVTEPFHPYMAARSPDRLREHLHPRGPRPDRRGRDRGRPGPVLRRRAAGATRTGRVERSATSGSGWTDVAGP